VICRSWKNRVKGRDLYDYVFYISRGTRVNLRHLQARIAQSGVIDVDKTITIEDVRNMLHQRFEQIDYKQAKEDVMPFIKDQSTLDLWSADFFNGITESLT
jgi:hypothetical protein